MSRLNHRWRKPLLFIVIFPIFARTVSLPVQSQESQDDASLKDRFHQEAPMRWREYSQKAEMLQGKYSFQMSQTLDNLKAQQSYDIKRNGERKLIIEERVSEREGKTRKICEARGVNPYYAFTLERFTLGRAQPSDLWALKELVDYKNQTQLEKIDPKKSTSLYDSDKVIVNSLVRVRNELLVDLVRNVRFQLIACRPLLEGAGELVEVTFDIAHETTPGENPIQSGILILDPQRFWCIRSYSFRAKYYNGRTQKASDQGVSKFRFTELNEAEGGLPIPKRALLETESIFADGTQNKQHWTFEYDLQLPKKLPAEEEFTLSAFGLPEPSGFDRPTRWYLWLGLTGIGCLVLAVYLKISKRRVFASKG